MQTQGPVARVPVLTHAAPCTQPEKVFGEIYRVLKPGGVCIVTFSNRQFYDKVGDWRALFKGI